MIATNGGHLDDGVDDDDIEELNDKTSSDSLCKLLGRLRQSSLFNTCFVSFCQHSFALHAIKDINVSKDFYLSEAFSKRCEHQIELGAVVVHRKLDQA